jgi:RNA polymerase sigma-70 factor (ECF subfamily)
MAEAEKTDDQLIAAHIAGDPNAFGTLYRRYSYELWLLVMSVLRDRCAADDVTQITFAKLHAFRHHYRAGTKLRNWLFTIAYNESLNEHRKRRRSGVALEVPLREGWAAAPDTGLSEQVVSVIRSLEPQHADQLYWYFFEGLTHREMAERMGVPEGTSKSRLSTAVAAFREAWKD